MTTQAARGRVLQLVLLLLLLCAGSAERGLLLTVCSGTVRGLRMVCCSCRCVLDNTAAQLRSHLSDWGACWLLPCGVGLPLLL